MCVRLMVKEYPLGQFELYSMHETWNIAGYGIKSYEVHNVGNIPFASGQQVFLVITSVGPATEMS